MSETLFLFATITPKPEFFAEARAALMSILPDTRKEQGCLLFDLLDDEQEGGRIYLWEEWADDAALQAHYAEPYTLAVFEKYRNWLAEPVAIVRMKKAG